MSNKSWQLCDELQLRAALPEDSEALALVGAASFLEAFAGTLPGPDLLEHCRRQHSAEQYAQWLAKSEYRLCLLEIRQAPVGYAVVCPPDLPVALEAGDLELKRLYLLHRFQGGGLGARLMQWSIAAAREAGAGRLLLGVKADNEAAIAFYRRFGYEVVGTRQFLVGTQLCDDLIFGLNLGF
jgi:diamine N-acetyltransferase